MKYVSTSNLLVKCFNTNLAKHFFYLLNYWRGKGTLELRNLIMRIIIITSSQRLQQFSYSQQHRFLRLLLQEK